MTLDVRMLTVGPVAENCFIARPPDADRAIVVDPGDEVDRLEAALAEAGISTVDAILLTHCHFDHVGAVAPLARATGAPVHCPEGEVGWLETILTFPGFGPFEGYTPEHTVAGGDVLELAGFTVDVTSTPGHSPDHVTYSIADEGTIFSGDVLFQGSVGRTDLPGADHATLLRSLATLLDTLPDETRVVPGHMGTTTLGRERQTNPYLRELTAR
jgi:glyoxylase-like metal-dependent hydrolase (beta-lactamase superfamily II)